MPPTLRPVLSPARRRRRRIVWTTATAIVAGVWVSSAGWYWIRESNHLAFYVNSGRVGVFGWPDPLQPRTTFMWMWDGPVAKAWLSDQVAPLYSPGQRGRWKVSVPLWVILAPLLFPTTRAWFAKSLSPSACPRCGYDLAGLAVGAPCPECGRTAAPRADAPAL